jgi:hypothetical protein
MSLNATIYDNNSAAEPLLQEEGQQHSPLNAKLFNSFKTFCLMIGLMVGFFIQCSTLGANFLVITIWGDDIVHKSGQDIIVFSILWSVFTSVMAIVILGFLRNLVTVTYNAVSSEDDRNLENMVLHMECRFVVGALVGVCMAWTITDILLGMKAQVVYSLVTLVVALLWCRLMTSSFTIEEPEKRISNRASDTVMTV